MEQVLIPLWPDAGNALGGVGRTKLFELVATGELRSVKIGRRRFIPVEAVREYVSRLEEGCAAA
jgi:excisionase family DNA binding protein